MREIKFRYYCDECNKWHYATLDDLCDPEALDFRVCHNNGNNASGFKEYMGLKDKNGVEIYEGDIIGITYRGGCCVASITFEDGCFRIKYPDDGSFHTFWDVSADSECEVIGNVYEHPELLEGE